MREGDEAAQTLREVDISSGVGDPRADLDWARRVLNGLAAALPVAIAAGAVWRRRRR